MEKIASFTIDHRKLKRGLYVSRKDIVGNETVTTFDIRMKEPNKEAALNVAAVHTIEHIGATFLRNHKRYAGKTIYFGPMGCLTGFYLILKGDLDSEDIVPLAQEMFKFISEFEGEIPGATEVECGNYRLMDLPQARVDAGKFQTEVLLHLDESQLAYPQ